MTTLYTLDRWSVVEFALTTTQNCGSCVKRLEKRTEMIL